MTREEFDALERRPCDRCQGGVVLQRNVNNNALQVVCGKCAARIPWRDCGVVNLKQNGRKARTDYPMGEDLDEVWDRFDNRCIVCGASKEELRTWGVGRQRQHVAEYAHDAHRGPILPICTDCHPFATQLQKMRALLRHSRTHGELAPRRGPGVPTSRLSPDSLPAQGQDAPRPLEGFPDDDADA